MATASDAQSSTNTGSQGVPPGDLNDFFDKLDLYDEDFDDVIVDEEEQVLQEGVCWHALARVPTTKNFSQAVRFRAIGANLLVVQVFCLGDW